MDPLGSGYLSTNSKMAVRDNAGNVTTSGTYTETWYDNGSTSPGSC